MARRVTFGIVAALSLIALWLAFSLRYEWYTDPGSLIVLRVVLGGGIVGIVACWVLLPSRVLVALLGIGVLILPPIIDRDFVMPDLGFAPYVLGVVAILAAATYLRRGLTRSNQAAS